MSESKKTKEKDFSPMMKKYLITKEQYKDCLLFYRLGDFYELFFEDAEIASKILDIALTSRACGLEERAPMCGVPYHAVDSYIAKIIEKGYKVAICDQLTTPVKGQIVERDVTRVITPGTVIESEILKSNASNYILSLCKKNEIIGCAFCDVSTGEFRVSEYKDNAFHQLLDLLSRIRPAEIICNEEASNLSFDKDVKALDFLPLFSKQIEFDFDEQNAKELIKKQFNISSFQGHDFAKLNSAICATGALITYLNDTQKRSLNHINKIITENNDDFMHLDYNACRNLELIENVKDKKKKGSLLGHLNKTKTAMGARLLEKWILQPLQHSREINQRLDCIEELYYNSMLQNDIVNVLSNINDIARTCSKISYSTIMPRDCVSLKNSLNAVIDLSNYAKDLKSESFVSLFKNIESLKNLADLLGNVFIENPPAITSGGGFIKEDFNKELYELRNISSQAKKWLAALEAKEREETGIKNLKIGYSRVFGYFIEVNKSQEKLVPYRYERRQTISNHERFITEELKEIENKLLNSEELANKLENTIFEQIKEKLKDIVSVIQKTADEVAFIDVISSLAKVAQEYNYTRPKAYKNRKWKTSNNRG